MVKSIIVVSDIEIDRTGNNDWIFYNEMKRRFEEKEYDIPNIFSGKAIRIWELRQMNSVNTMGMPVRDVICNTYGVLVEGKEDWGVCVLKQRRSFMCEERLKGLETRMQRNYLQRI